MSRINLDKESPDVRQFIQNLLVEEGVDLEINGRVVCRVIPSAHLSDAEKERLIRDRWALIHRAQERNRNVPADVLEREVLEASTARGLSRRSVSARARPGHYRSIARRIPRSYGIRSPASIIRSNSRRKYHGASGFR